MSKKRKSYIGRLYDMFGAGLSYKEFERLIKNDAPGVLEFYTQKIAKPDKSKSRPMRYIYLVRETFIAFIMKMAPIRRLFYAGALFFFVIGYLNADSSDMLLSFVVLNLLLAFELADKFSAKDELDVARDIQESILPQTPPQIPGYDISFFYETAKEVGGDYYDFMENGKEDPFTIAIGDISGKGMGAALYMIQVQAVFRIVMQSFVRPKEILINLNKQLKTIFRSNAFFTVSVASIAKDNTFSLCRAGHLPLLYYNNSNKTCEFIKPKGIGIGLRDNGIFENVLEEIKISPSHGDIFVLFTDGVSECMDKEKNEYGEENLERVITKYADSSTEELQKLILTSLRIFSNGAPRHDDITFIILKAL